MDLTKNKDEQITSEESARRMEDLPPVAAGAARAQRSLLDDMNDSVKQVDKNVIIRLLTNPLESMNLHSTKDLIYGVLGIAAAIIGFLIWAMFIGNKVESVIMRAFGFGGISSFADLFETHRSISAAVYGKMFLIAILSSASLLAAIWSIGSWKGGQRLSIKSLITHIGAMQYIAGAGFIISGILALMSFKLSIFVLTVTLLSTLILSITGAMDLYQVAKEHRALYIVCTISAYLVLFVLLAGAVL